jgi:hypothetical protein
MAPHAYNPKRITWLLLAVATTAVLLLSSALHNADWLGSPPAIAQRVSPDTVWQQVYQKLPDFPRENQYVSVETRKVATDNTLVGRVVRYHIYVKGRPPQYRLDWKITLADYLGINERMDEGAYPSRNTLKTNPLDGDLAVMNRLTRQQRESLIQALVEAFAVPVRPSSPAASPTPVGPTPTPKPLSSPIRGPGAADLLK